MVDNYILTGDQVVFLPNFGSAIITPIPGVIIGSAAKMTVNSKPVCLQGDEKKVVVSGVAYINGSFAIPGVGTLTIEALGGDQTSKKTTVEGKPPIVMGTMFTAKFTVMTPAQMPTPSGTQPDGVPMFTGQGMFVPTNMTVLDGG